MHRLVASLVFCFAVSSTVSGQNSIIKPMHVDAGSNLTFHILTRLDSSNTNAADLLPKGTQIAIKVLDPIDSASTRDGSEFHGLVTSQVLSPDGVVIRSGAEVKGLFVLLRSKNHPDGFRYELLITEIIDGGKSFRLSASLNTSFVDVPAQSDVSKTSEPATKLGSVVDAPANSHQ